MAARTGGWAALWLLTGLVVFAAQPAAAQPAAAQKAAATGDAPVTIILPAGATPAQVEATLKAVQTSGLHATIRWDGPGRAVPAPASPAAASGAGGVWPTFQAGLAVEMAAMPALPALAGDAVAALRGRGAQAWAVLAALAAALGAAWLAWRLLRRAAAGRSGAAGGVPGGAPDGDVLGRLRASSLMLGVDLGALAVLILVGRMLVARLAGGGPMGLDTVDAVAGAGLYVAAARFLLSPEAPARRLLPIDRPGWHFRMAALYGAAAEASALLLRGTVEVARTPGAAAGLALLASTLVTVLKIVWFWRGRHDIAALVRRTGAAGPPGLLRQVAAVSLPMIYIATSIIIWAIGRIAVVAAEGRHWGGPAVATQILIVLLPILAAGAASCTGCLVARRQNGIDQGGRALEHVVRTLAGGIVWIVGIVAVARAWGIYVPGVGSTAAPGAAVRVALALTAGWAALGLLEAYFALHGPRRPVVGDEEETVEIPIQGRVATVMPLARNLGRGAVVAVTALVVLSTLGADIAPLLAGFGVIGLAISFGSQALVRDIVSGIFFMAEDAFRVGEYIDTGRLKGTVEKITLRSVQLRHQNGQIHTIPFGQLLAITNFSRDWATIKFLIRLDRRSDIELARRTIKKVGQQMLLDPELGSEFIQPLKMQGVYDITDSAIVLRLKFTSKPLKPTWLQREALRRVYEALHAVGIEFASNAVTVRQAGDPAVLGAVLSSLASAEPPPPAA